MARPRKTGMEYFPMDCNFDVNVEGLAELHGNDALAFLLRFWQMAYKTENGEINYHGVIRRIITNKLFQYVEQSKIEQILADAIELGLIDGDAYKKGILTSSGIKKRFGSMEQVRKNARERQLSRSYSTNNEKQLPLSRSNSKLLDAKESKEKESKENSTVHTDPEVRTKHKDKGPSPSLCGEENKKEKSAKEKKPPLPLWDSCEFFRMTSHEYELARVWYLKNRLSEQELKKAIETVENWLVIGRTNAALKARESANHLPYLYQQWAIEQAKKMVLLTGPKKLNNKSQATLDFLKEQYQEAELEDRARTIIDVTEIEQ